MKEGGRALVSIPTVRSDVRSEGRNGIPDGMGRLFTGSQAGGLALPIEQAGFRAIGRWESDDLPSFTIFKMRWRIKSVGVDLTPNSIQ